MLDIQFIRDNPELVQTKSGQKGYSVNVRELLELDQQRRGLTQKIDELRAQRNELAAKLKGDKPAAEQIEQGKRLKEEVAELEKQLAPVDVRFDALLRQVPNVSTEDVPVGTSEADNVVAKTVGEQLAYDFKPKQHWEIAEPRDLVDKERAAKIAGSRFAYIKGDLVRLQFAIIQFVLQTLGDERIIERIIQDNNLKLVAKPFTPILPPAVLRTEPYIASARLNAEEQTYKLADDDLWLNASAEHTLCTMYWNEIIPEEVLPIRYIGYGTAFRREAGSYGKDTEGIFRLHQFDKLEMEVFSTPETGMDEHKLQIAIQEYLVQQIRLPYQLIQKCTFDIGKPNASGFDINCWFPGQGSYRETHTADYMTDYQARDLKIRYKSTTVNEQGFRAELMRLVHTSDATAFALGRVMAAIIENFQTHDGRIIVPEVLRPFVGGQAEL